MEKIVTFVKHIDLQNQALYVDNFYFTFKKSKHSLGGGTSSVQVDILNTRFSHFKRKVWIKLNWVDVSLQIFVVLPSSL